MPSGAQVRILFAAYTTLSFCQTNHSGTTSSNSYVQTAHLLVKSFKTSSLSIVVEERAQALEKTRLAIIIAIPLERVVGPVFHGN